MRILRRLSATFLTMLLLFNATACQLPQGLMPGFNTSNSEEAEPSHDHSYDHSSEVHEHTFYSHWSYDNSFHWHDASCDHNVRDSYTTHTFSDWKILVEPSETFNGVKERSCSVCNYTVRENIPMGTHTHKPIEGIYLLIEPNCVTYGLIEYDCACGEHIKETLPMLDHNKVYDYEHKEETHIAYIKCEVCDYNEIIEEPHQLEEKIIYEATEYDDGLKIVYCYICGYEKEERIPSFNHKHDYEYYVIKVEPTCQNEGYTRHNCICGEYYDSDIVEKQHSYYSSYDYNPDNHWLNYHCNYCDDKYMDMEESHKFEISVVREPTEKQDGIYRYSCICGYEYDEIIPSAVCEHDYFPEFNWSNINGHVDLEIKLFCTKNPNHILEEGNYDYGYILWAWVSEPTCVCEGIATYRGEVIYNGITYYDYKDFELPADPAYHHYEETVIPPTCEDEGYTIYTCKDCGYSYKDNYAAMLGHAGKYSVYYDDLYHYDYFECDVCDYTDMYNPKKHNFTTQYGHDEINYEHWFVDTCYECGYSQIRDKIMHQFNEEVIITPTEEFDGLARYTCYCGHSYEEVLPMLNHTHDYQAVFNWNYYGELTLDVSFVCSKDSSHVLSSNEYTYEYFLVAFTPSTCIQTGSSTFHAEAVYNNKVFSNTYTFDMPLDYNNHNYSCTYVAPTCEEKGYYEYVCQYCNDYYTVDESDALGHNYEVTSSHNESYHYDVYTCYTCAHSYIDNEVAHNIIRETTYDDNEHWSFQYCPECIYYAESYHAAHTLERLYYYEPTEEADGCYCDACLYCDYENYQLIPALGHTHDYQPVFNWDNENSTSFEVSLVCVKNAAHVIEQSQLQTTWFSNGYCAPTCTTDGYEIIVVCVSYEELYFEVEHTHILPALGHDYIVTEEFYPSCVAESYKVYTCHCGDYFFGEYSGPLGHVYNVEFLWGIEDDACQVQVICARCSDTYYDNVIAREIGRVESTNTVPGYIIYEATYVVDGVEYSSTRQCELPILCNHSYMIYPLWNTMADMTVNYELTCEYCGYTIYDLVANVAILENIPSKCIEMGHIKYNISPIYDDIIYSADYYEYLPVDVNAHDYNYETIVVEPTCEQQGYTIHRCICGSEYTDNYVDALGHDYQVIFNWYPNWAPLMEATLICNHDSSHQVQTWELMTGWETLERIEPTCDGEGFERVKGYVTYGDLYFEEEFSYALSPLGHSYDSFIDYDENYHWERFSCVVCGLVYDSNFSSHELTCYMEQEATEEVEGLNRHECFHCDYMYYESIPALGHTHDYYFIVESFDASCEMDGYTRYTCRCGDFYDSDFVPMYGHNYQTTMNFNEFEHYYYDVCLNCFNYQNRDYLPHEFSYNVEVTPTEYYPGLGRYTCYCGYEYSEEIPMLGHTHDYNYDLDTILPTCEQQGYTIYTCSCGDFYIDNYIDALGHDLIADFNWDSYFNNGYISIVISCLNDPSHVYYDADFQHYVTFEETNVPTCEEDGLVVYTAYAFHYQEFTSTYEIVIPKMGHDYNVTFAWGANGTVDVFIYCNNSCLFEEYTTPDNCYLFNSLAPTEETEGFNEYIAYITYNGVYFEDNYIEIIPCLTHEHNYNYDISIIEPTCEEYGFTIYTCSCGDYYEIDHIEPLGHDIVYTPALEATCENDGLTEGNYCDRCMQVFSYPVVIPALGHDYVAVYSFFPNTDDLVDIDLVCQNDRSHLVKEEQMDTGWYAIEKIEPTCIESGFEKVIAYADYNGMHFETEYSYYPNPLGHNYHNYERVEPNCVSYGYERYYCDCGDYTETILDPIPATGHNLTEISEYNENYHYSVLVCLNEGCNFRQEGSYNYHNLNENIINYPTCDESGLSYVYCSECEYNSYVEVPTYGHDYQANFTWFLAEDIPFEVYLQCNRDSSHIVGGWEMEIGWQILQQVDPTCTTDGYIDVYGYAIYDGLLYEKYDTYILTASGEHIYNNEYVCIDCGHYYYTEGLQFELNSFNSYSVVGYSGSDSNIIIPAFYEGLPVEEINSNAFINIDVIESIYIGSNILFIHPQAINACCNLKYIYIPASVFKIAEGAITWCASLTNIEVSLDNHTYDSRENCNAVIETSSNTLLVGCIGTVIPNSVTAIYPQAFEHQDTLYEVYIPENVQLIQQYAFFMSFGIQTVYILNKNIIIENNAFMDCSQISVVNFAGSETEWNNLVIGSGNEYLLNAQINYNYGHEHDYQAYFTWFLAEDIPFEVYLQCNRDSSHIVGGWEMEIGWQILQQVDPTCTTEGYIDVYGYAIYDGILYEKYDSYVLTAGAHNYNEEYVCIDCGHYYYTEGLMFSLDPTAQEYVVSGYNGTDSNVIIPECYEGLPVTAIGNMSFYDNLTVESLYMPDTIKSIGNDAFYFAHNLASIKMSSNLTSIGQYAFGKCYLLAEIDIPDSVTYIGYSAFCNCESLLEVRLPEGIEEIAAHLFNGSMRLTVIEIPSSVKSIGESAFYDTSLSTVNYRGNQQQWSEIVIDYSYNDYLLQAVINYNYGHEHDYQVEVFEATCEEDGYTRHTCICGDYFDSDYVYATGHNSVDGYCSVCGILIPSEGLEFTLFNYEGYALTGLGTCTDNDIIIPEYYNGLPVTRINDNAFYECDSLTSIIISDSVTSIGYESFFGCDSLTTVVIGNSLTEISSCAFQECRALTSINIPNTVTYIGESSFQDCSSLTSIVIPEGVTYIGNNQYSGCSSLTNITIPSTVTGIGSFAFYNCTSLETAIFEEGSQLSDIWNGVFLECDSLISISIPEGVTFIENCAFWGCDSLVSITIPESVTKIYEDAFHGCDALTHIFYEGNEEKFNEIMSGHESDIVNATVIYNYHHDNHNYFIEITTEPTSSKDGYVKTYCSCGEFIVSRVLPSLGEKESAHTFYADNVFASKYGEVHEFNYDYLNDTYNVNGVTITTHDVLIDTDLEAHNLFLMKDCINGVNPSITIENVQVNSVQITFFDSSYSYAGYIDVYLDGVRLEENVLYREQIYGDVYKVVYEYYLSETATGTLIIENNDNGTKVIDTIKIYDN